MAVLALRQLTFAKNKYTGARRGNRGGPEELYIKEAASQSYKAGQLVYLVSGLVTTAGTATFNSIANIVTSLLAGVAAEDASGVTNASANIVPLKPGDQFWAQVYHTTLASAVTSQAQLGTRLCLAKVGDNYHVSMDGGVPELTTAIAVPVKIVGFPGEEDLAHGNIGDQHGYVLIEFEPYSVDTAGGELFKSWFQL